MNLARAIEIAVTAHKSQVDKGGNPYILHPLNVMMSLDSEEEMIAGVLHDVVEDCEGWSFEKLELEGFSKPIIEALKSVTKLSENEVSNDVIDQIFRIYKVGQVQRIGQNTLIYLLQFSAPEFIQSRRKYLIIF